MEKIVIISESGGTIFYVLKVKNWDEKFKITVENAVQVWKRSKDELSSVIMTGLRKAGYDAEILDYEEVGIYLG